MERYVQGAEDREAQRQIEAVKIDDLPTRQEMMKRQSDRIWRAEITYKEVTSQDQTKGHSQGMKR